ncbi:HupE/UreJ family protein [Fontimonas sp. SYSU GA230001]|uniref:HupE/UreJ family protein n=1 Tax=Fontimonas sp. SYSU GA230001 TaxID=3142450 RepID=UPI0032B452D3
MASALLLIGAQCLAPAWAHNRSVSYSDWDVAGNELRATVRLPTAELNPLSLDPFAPATTGLIAQRVGDGFQPESVNAPCAVVQVDARLAGQQFLIDARWHCAGPPVRLRTRFLLDAIPGHLHLLQWRSADATHGPFALSAANDVIAFDTATGDAPAPSFQRYLSLGLEHILLGWDHLAFLLAVLLGAATLPALVWRVTGFTLGHSLTLALAALGGIRPSALLVESFIALTIVCAAAERALAGHRRALWHGAALAATLALAGWLAGALPLPLLLAVPLLMLGNGSTAPALDSARTALFGLFHGFGFAGVLAQLSAAQSVPPLPLLGFNLGVELGQLLFVLPLWWATRKWASLRSPIVPAVILALGCAWYLQRISS